MVDVGTISIDIVAEIGDLKKDLKAAQNELKEFKRHAGTTSSATKGLTVSMGSLAGAIGGLSLLALGRDLLETTTQFQSLNATLKSVTGSTESANRHFAQLRGFAASTPYALNEVVSSFTKLKSMGLDPSIESLRSYGNTASAMGKDLNQFIEAVADAAVGEFERLKEFGIKASSEGDKVRFMFKGVTTEVEKDSEAIQQYLRNIGETEFATAMEDQMNTLKGAISNLGDSWDTMLVGIAEGTGMATLMAQSIKALATAFDQLRAAIAPTANDMLAELREQYEQIGLLINEEEELGMFGGVNQDAIDNYVQQREEIARRIGEIEGKLAEDKKKLDDEVAEASEERAKPVAQRKREAEIKEQEKANKEKLKAAQKLADEEFQLRIEMLEAENLQRQEMEDARIESLRRLKREEEERQKLIEAVKKEEIKREEAQLAEWQKITDQIGQSLSDALMEGGKSGWEYIKGLFRNMVLRPLIQPIMGSIAGAFIGGGAGIANASGGGSLLGDGSSLMSIGGGFLRNGLEGAVGAVGNPIAQGVAIMASMGLTSSGGGAAALASGGINSMGSSASLAAAEATSTSIISNAVAGAASAGILSGLATYFATGEAAPAIGSGLGAAGGFYMGAQMGGWGGPIGAVIGGILGTLVGGLFSGKPSNKSAFGEIDMSTGEIISTGNMTGSKQASQKTIEGRDAMGEILTSIIDAIDSLGGSLEGLLRFDIGERDGLQLWVDGIKQSLGDNFGDAVPKMIEALINQADWSGMFNDSETFGMLTAAAQDSLRQALGNVESVEELDAIVSQFTMIDAVLSSINENAGLSGLTQYERALLEVNNQFDAYKAQLQALGVDVDKVTALEEARAAAIEAILPQHERMNFQLGVQARLLAANPEFEKFVGIQQLFTQHEEELRQARERGLDTTLLVRAQEIELANARRRMLQNLQSDIQGFVANIQSRTMRVSGNTMAANLFDVLTSQAQEVAQAQAAGMDTAALSALHQLEYQQAAEEQIKAAEEQLKSAQNAIVTAQQEMAAASSQASSAAAQRTAEAWAQVADEIERTLNDLMGGALSTLSPEQKLAFTQQKYSQALSAAQGGDVEAAGQVSGLATSYLEAARNYFGSGGGYADIFGSVTGELGGLQGMAEGKGAFSSQKAATLAIAANTENQIELLQQQLDNALAASDIAKEQFAINQSIGNESLENLRGQLNSSLGLETAAQDIISTAVTEGARQYETAVLQLDVAVEAFKVQKDSLAVLMYNSDILATQNEILIAGFTNLYTVNNQIVTATQQAADNQEVDSLVA